MIWQSSPWYESFSLHLLTRQQWCKNVANTSQSTQSVPPAGHLDNTPYVTGILFRIKFGRVILGKMADVGPERYSTIGMRLGKLIIMALIHRGDIELHTIEFMLYLFLEVAKESMEILAKPKDEDAPKWLQEA
jgi:hypothetical protein